MLVRRITLLINQRTFPANFPPTASLPLKKSNTESTTEFVYSVDNTDIWPRNTPKPRTIIQAPILKDMLPR